MIKKQLFQTPVLCPTHNREVELYCPQTDSAICFMCVATTHHGFKCQALNEAYQEKKQKILDRNEKLSKIVTDLNRAAQEVEKVEKEIDQQEVKIRTEIDDIFEKLQKELNHRHQILLSEVSTLTKQKKQLLQQQNPKIQDIEGGFRNGLNQLNQSLQSQPLLPARILLLHQKLNQLYENYYEKQNLSFLPETENNIFFSYASKIIDMMKQVGTVTSISTSSQYTIAEGEALSSYILPSPFTIHAKDNKDEFRTNGGDIFPVGVKRN